MNCLFKRAGILGDIPKQCDPAWFRVTSLTLPLAAFSAVLLAPSLGGSQPAQANEVADRENAHFALCTGSGRITCIVDGDTIWYQGTKIRIADIDTPEISRPACPREAQLGKQATARMQTLLNAGTFTLAPNPDGRAQDRYGRALLVVMRDGESLGMQLVREGLAEQWGGPRLEWC